MWLNKLEITNFRCYSSLAVSLEHVPWIVLGGGNGAGKTSLMEALYAASRGRSFRRGPVGEMIRADCDTANVIVGFENGGSHRLGVRFSRDSRVSHLDGQPAEGLARISAMLPVEYLGGASHRLVDGPPAIRRRFIDWALFHVEHQFLDVWRFWRRAHRQRNEWLRRGDYMASESWTVAVAQPGEKLTAMRSSLIGRLAERLANSPEVKIQGLTPRLRFRPGWRGDSLLEDLHRSREREHRVGRAVVGPQYDDWTLEFDGLRSDQLSRGQSKLASIFLWQELGRMMLEEGRPAILLADDFLADLDDESIQMAISALNGSASQVWLAVQEKGGSLNLSGEALRFHVEHGVIHPL